MNLDTLLDAVNFIALLFFLYLARFFVIGVDDNADKERCSADSFMFKYTDLLQYNPGHHAVRETEDSTSPKHRESKWTKASGLRGSQNCFDAISQNLEDSKIIKVTTPLNS